MAPFCGPQRNPEKVSIVLVAQPPSYYNGYAKCAEDTKLGVGETTQMQGTQAHLSHLLIPLLPTCGHNGTESRPKHS